jgi:hypothetical protein
VDLKSALSEDTANAPSGMEIRVPKPAPGGLAMLDPGTVQIILALASGTGAVALALKGMFQVLNKYVETRGAGVRVKIGANTLDLPANLPLAERSRMYDEFVSRVAKDPK